MAKSQKQPDPSAKRTLEQKQQIVVTAINEVMAGQGPGQNGTTSFVHVPKGTPPTKGANPTMENLGKAAQ
jgi:hypothetical protein